MLLAGVGEGQCGGGQRNKLGEMHLSGFDLYLGNRIGGHIVAILAIAALYRQHQSTRRSFAASSLLVFAGVYPDGNEPRLEMRHPSG